MQRISITSMAADGERESSYSLDDLSQESDSEPLVNRVGFIAFGFVAYLLFSVAISAAQDILAATLIPTPVVVLLIYFSALVVALILPHFVERIPQTVLLVLIVVSLIGGQVVYIVAQNVLLRLAGAAIEAVGYSMAEVTYVSRTALYGDNAMAWFSFGTGIGIVSGPVYFAGMTTIICVSPNTAALIVSGTPLVFVLFYIIMDKRNYQQEPTATSQKDSDVTQSNTSKQNQLTLSDKLALMRQGLPAVLAYSIGSFAGFITISSIVTTLAFQGAPFSPRDHYLYYLVTYTIGECVGRSHISIISLFTSKCTLVVKRTWILAGVLVMLSILAGFAAWYRFLPSVWIVLLLVFVIGFLLGDTYISTLLTAAEDEDYHSKVFSRGFALVGLGTGVILAGFAGSLIETALREHCPQTGSLEELCFTRSMTGWNSTASCLTH